MRTALFEALSMIDPAHRWMIKRLQRRGRTGRVTVWLAAGAERIEVGRHLLDARRMQLAEELKMALARPLPA